MRNDALVLLEVIGLRPVMVDDLREQVVLFPEYGLALIRSGLDERELHSVTDWALAAAADLLAAW